MNTRNGNDKMFAQSPRKYVVVYSSGCSGSNRLLDLLDQHELTNCRNEIHAQDPVFTDLCNEAERSATTEVGKRWNDAIERAALRKGSRDRFALRHKAYLKPNMTSLWCQLIRRRKLRSHVLGITQDDWSIPGMLINWRYHEAIVPVIKISRPPQLFIATHDADDAQILVQNFRNPTGYLASWFNRYALMNFANLEELYTIVRQTTKDRWRLLGRDLELTENYSLRALFVAELWLWRYQNEPVFDSLRGSPRYKAVLYQHTSEKPTDVAQQIYQHAGFEFTDVHLKRTGSMPRTLFLSSHSTVLDENLLKEVAEEVLAGSELYEFIQAGSKSPANETSSAAR